MAAFAVQELLSAIMVILVLELALVLSQKMIILKPKLPLCHPFIIVLRKKSSMTPPPPHFLMVLFTRNRYKENIFEGEKELVVEVVVFTYK